MKSSRQCVKQGCALAAVATLTYVYADSTVVVGHLAVEAEPHSYDLCAHHADRFSAPRGWDVVHVHQEFVDIPPSDDDIDALARAIRQAGKDTQEPLAAPPLASEPRRGHLRVVSNP